jgi:hypothetical protein
MKLVKNIHIDNITNGHQLANLQLANLPPANFLLTVEHNPYFLNNTIQAVYKYFIDGLLVITYYTNGRDCVLNPVYHALEQWSKEKLDSLLAKYLP